MGQQQSKDELLYQEVSYGNIEAIKSLHQQGASLEWIDKEGKTPLMLSCLNSELYDVAKTLIELGANINAYRAGRNGGTPLHHAAKRGLDNIVKLLLSQGANPLVLNDDYQTPLEVARAKGFTNVVRTIENHICLFSGWLREFYGPGFLEVLAPHFLSRKVWVVVLPTGSRNALKPYKLELGIYSGIQDAQPRTLIALWKANLEDPKFRLSDPSVEIVEITTMSRGRRRRHARHRSRTVCQTHIKLAPANEGDKQQLQWFCDACKGIPRATHPPAFIQNSHAPIVQATAPSVEDMELAMAINASIQTEMPKAPSFETHIGALSAHGLPPPKVASGDWVADEAGPSGSSSQQTQTQTSTNQSAQSQAQVPESAPSAPPIVNHDEIIQDGPIHYPSIDFSPNEISSQPVEKLASSSEKKEEGSSSSCVICLDAPVEGACIPCGHMAGCMSCLKEIKAKKWGCPVCRGKIDQVVRLYSV